MVEVIMVNNDSKTNEERYRGILEDMEEAYFEVDLEGKFTFFSPSAAKKFGYNEDELLGMSYKDYMDEKNMEKVFKAYHREHERFCDRD
jgi:PAS domain S-box-containing protein